ncbi:pleckstrin homology-like domain family B member 1 [Bacillus rossius redtenbacheri]|uniref:pleckstrin homology-like domain family B member 1 n=1 Tax=Bacillus rossius redtenbacheri TaxID=93214 RepID=UPI002FDD699E
MTMATLQKDGVEVLEAGRALKVQADSPHLVSMGGGRLSTAVTLHPLPPGRVTLGSSPACDVMVLGTGVQPAHCHIENSHGVVTLHPLADMTAVDGLKVTAPTRLMQGCMICIGRSNYLRFNHPAEARLMRSILPNSRISMMPLSLYSGDSTDGNGQALDKKPPMAPRRSPRDSWGDVSNSSSCNSGSNDECCAPGKAARARLLSPKVFPPGSATVNSPASAVLGSARLPAALRNGSPTYQNVPSPLNGDSGSSGSQGGTPVPPRPAPGDSRSVTSSPAFDGRERSSPSPSVQNGRLSEAAAERGRLHSVPSPAFNRSPGPSGGAGRRSATPSGHRRTLSAGHDLASYDSSCSLDEMTARSEELEHKRQQAQQERLQEQEVQKQERARLEEILAMCAEYERQNKPPVTPNVHQNRIKTNGSLPRDKRLPSPGVTAADGDESPEVFTFDTSSAAIFPRMPMLDSSAQSVSLSSGPGPSNTSTPVSSRTASGPAVGRSPYENVVLVHPQSPRTRIKTIASSSAKEQSSRDNLDVLEHSRLSSSNDYEYIVLRGGCNNSSSESQNSVSQPVNSIKNIDSSPKRRSFERDKFIRPLEEKLDKRVPGTDLTDSSSVQSTTNNNNNNAEVISVISKRRGMSKDIEINFSNKDQNSHVPLDQTDSIHEVNHQNQRKLPGDEVDGLRKERAKLLAAMSGLKRKVADIEQQEEELLTELEMERALVDGERAAQREKLSQEQERLGVLRGRVAGLDRDAEQCRAEDLQRQADCKKRLQAVEGQIARLEKELESCCDVDWQQELTDNLKHKLELLEAERKVFEDLEFRQLEEEANFLAGREEVQREISELTTRVQCRQLRLQELDDQRAEAAEAVRQESHDMEKVLIAHLRRLEEVRNRLRAIERRMEELAGQSVISSQDSSPDDGDEVGSQQVTRGPKQSQDDLDRISRVTSGAPMEVCSGSLGRKTLESLKEIERNRQRHLAQQGSQVIEQERKRVQELKQRVQDEVRAEWEQRRGREPNCDSFNSEESSLTSGDVPTESTSSDDALEKQAAAPGSSDSADRNEAELSAGQKLGLMRERELARERDEEETRPLSDGSNYEHHLATKMRTKMDKKQRPLTRYLPIRSESLNLRAHIETAGHQVELCPHVIIDSTSCRGYLHKMGSKFHHWNKRWFVFDRSKRTLVYYGDRTEKKVRGGTYFQAIEEVYVDHLNSVKSPNPQLTFVVKTNERSYHLMAPSAEAMRIWVDVIFTGAEGYQEFEHGS